MWFPIATFCAVTCILAARRRERRSPLLLALYAWVGSLALAAPILFSYRVDYSLKADVVVGAGLLITTGMYLLVRRPSHQRIARQSATQVEYRTALGLGVIGTLGCMLLLADARASGLPFSVTYLLDNLGRIRDAQFESLAASANRESSAL